MKRLAELLVPVALLGLVACGGGGSKSTNSAVCDDYNRQKTEWQDRRNQASGARTSAALAWEARKRTWEADPAHNHGEWTSVKAQEDALTATRDAIYDKREGTSNIAPQLQTQYYIPRQKLMDAYPQYYSIGAGIGEGSLLPKPPSEAADPFPEARPEIEFTEPEPVNPSCPEVTTTTAASPAQTNSDASGCASKLDELTTSVDALIDVGALLRPGENYSANYSFVSNGTDTLREGRRYLSGGCIGSLSNSEYSSFENTLDRLETQIGRLS
jgi:hypothetical protein